MRKYLAIFSVVAVLIFGFFSFIYLAYGCSYSGQEFSPDDFSIRYFKYRYEPITETVLRGRTFTKDSGDWPNLVTDKLVKPIYKKEKTWHLIHDNGNYLGGASVDSDARFLINFLSLRNENGENTWMAWNSENPKLAKVLWPFIAEMAVSYTHLTLPTKA